MDQKRFEYAIQEARASFSWVRFCCQDAYNAVELLSSISDQRVWKPLAEPFYELCKIGPTLDKECTDLEHRTFAEVLVWHERMKKYLELYKLIHSVTDRLVFVKIARQAS